MAYSISGKSLGVITISDGAPLDEDRTEVRDHLRQLQTLDKRHS